LRLMVYHGSVIPTFEGKHNAVKVRIWTILLDRYIRGLGGLTLRELVAHASLPYGALSSLICR